MVDGFEAAHAAFYLGASCLYDSVHLDYKETAGEGKEWFLPCIISEYPSAAGRYDDRTNKNYPDPVIQKQHSFNAMDQTGTILKSGSLNGWETGQRPVSGISAVSVLVLDTDPPVIRIPGVVENANLQRSSRIASCCSG